MHFIMPIEHIQFYKSHASHVPNVQTHTREMKYKTQIQAEGKKNCYSIESENNRDKGHSFWSVLVG